MMSKSLTTIVCGASKPTDDWFMGNLLGFRAALDALGLKESTEAYTCFPVRKYLYETQDRDFKFGLLTGGTSTETNYTTIYTKQDYTSNDREKPVHQFNDYDWVSMDRMEEAIAARYELARTTLVSGDTYNLILLGHEVEPPHHKYANHGDYGNGGFVMGGRIVTPATVDSWIGAGKMGQEEHTRLVDGVHVNLIFQTRHSALFVEAPSDAYNQQRSDEGLVQSVSQNTDSAQAGLGSPSGRYRNAIYPGSFLACLALASQLPDLAIEGNVERIEATTPKSTPSTATPPSMELEQSDGEIRRRAHQQLISKFLNVLFADFEELSFTNCNNTDSARYTRRVFQPVANMDDVFNQESMPSEVWVEPSNLKATESYLEEEVHLAYGNSWRNDPYNRDALWEWFFKWHSSTNPASQRTEAERGKAQAATVEGLRWRFQIQNHVFLAYIELCERGFCTMSAFDLEVDYYLPADLRKHDKNVCFVEFVLEQFTLGHHLTQHPFYPPRGKHSMMLRGGDFTTPLHWLATMIVRGGRGDLRQIVRSLQAVGHLGRWQPKEGAYFYNNWMLAGFRFDPSAYASRGVWGADQSTLYQPEQLGAWLPAGWKYPGVREQWLASYKSRYAKLQTIYSDVFDPDIWWEDVEMRDFITTFPDSAEAAREKSVEQDESAGNAWVDFMQRLGLGPDWRIGEDA